MQFLVDLTPCVDGGCGENGYCKEYFSGVLHYSVCECIGRKYCLDVILAGGAAKFHTGGDWCNCSPCFFVPEWRGYGCTDDSVAMPDWEQKLAAFLLTFSNLFFIPAILLSLYRRFWTEALVYFYTMFFSAVSAKDSQ